MIFVQPRHFVVDILKFNFILVPLPDGVYFVTFSHIYIYDGKSEKHIKMAENPKREVCWKKKKDSFESQKSKKKIENICGKRKVENRKTPARL